MLQNYFDYKPKPKRGSLQFNSISQNTNQKGIGTNNGIQSQITQYCTAQKKKDFAYDNELKNSDEDWSETSDSESDTTEGNLHLHLVCTYIEVNNKLYILYKGRLLMYEEAKNIFNELLTKIQNNM